MLYDIVFLIFSLFYLPTLIFKGKLHADFGERLGRYSKDKREALISSKGAIWIQAVSVGEVAVCGEFVKTLKERFPDKRIVLSTVTKTGNDLAKKLYGAGGVTVIYLPLDLSWVVKKAAALIDPCFYVMVETELWPNMIREMSRRKVPSCVVNGRISDRSFGKYMMVKRFLKPVLGMIDRFCMQSVVDAERIRAMGAPAEKVIVTGNMKFDTEPKTDEVSLERMRKLIGMDPGGRLLAAGSIHPGEELPILEAYTELKKEFTDLKVVLAPRHVENFPYFESIVKDDFGFTPSLFSRPADAPPERRVTIIDKIGHLTELYALATVVFIGGSLVRHGGQNPLEAAVFEKPVIFGPHMFNFRDISESLLASGGAIRVNDKSEMVAAIRGLFLDDNKRRGIGQKARQALIARRGATQRNLQEIEKLIHSAADV